jgi:peptide/nickel transport system substrate-binding protein
MGDDSSGVNDSHTEAEYSRSAFLRLSAGVAVAGGLAGALDAPALAGSLEATASNQLTLAIFQDPDTLDPASTSLTAAGQVIAAVFDPLLYAVQGQSKRVYYPGLATGYSASGDATRYRFHLRHGVKFHDGTPFDATAVKATFDYIVDPSTKAKSELGSLGAYQQTRIIDPFTVEIVFKQPNAAFANEMTTISIASPTAMKKYGSQFGRNPVGTGPFIFKSWTPGQQVEVVKNPAYTWGPGVLGHKGPAYLDQLTFRVLQDPSAQFNALQTGEVTVAQNLTTQAVAQALKGTKFKNWTAQASGLPYAMIMNVRRPPTKDVRVRRALIHATDREGIAKTLYQGLYTASKSIVTPATPGFHPSQDLYPYDPERAGHLLDQAGWRAGSGGQRSKAGTPLAVSVINAQGFGFDDISQLMQSEFKKVGVKATITDQAFPAVNTTYANGVMNLSNWFWFDVDPSFLRVLFSCSQIGVGFNNARYCNPKIDAALTAADSIGSAPKRAAAYSKIILTLMQAAVAIPIHDLQTIFVGPSQMKGIVFKLDATPLFHEVQL